MFGHSALTWFFVILVFVLSSFVLGPRLALFFGFIAIWVDMVYPEIVKRRERQRFGIH